MDEIGDPHPASSDSPPTNLPVNAEGFRPLAEEGKKKRWEGAAGVPLSYQETALQTLGDSGLHVVRVKKKKKKALRTRRSLP